MPKPLNKHGRLPKVSLPPEPVSVDESDLTNLMVLTEALRTQGAVAVEGSPFSVVLRSIADLVARLPQLLFSPFEPTRNSELKFEEQAPVTDTWDIEEHHERTRDNSFYNSPAMPGKDFVNYDPIASKKDKPVYYVYKSDPLGNPLQVQVDLSAPKTGYTDRDKRQLAQFFSDLDQTLMFLASGIVDWSFLKMLRRFYRPGIESQISTNKSTKASSQYYYLQRLRQKIFPKRSARMDKKGSP